jgi:FlaA1/EpsC-like NDP-sugar epimerase
MDNSDRLDRVRRDLPLVSLAAAHKHVPLLELHPEEALATNVTGTANLADAHMKALAAASMRHLPSQAHDSATVVP